MREKKYFVPPYPIRPGATEQTRPKKEYMNADTLKQRVKSAGLVDDTPRVEHVDGEVLTDECKDVNYWSRLYFQAARKEFEKFADQFPKRLERPYVTWLSYILYMVRENTPVINKKDPDMVQGAWNALCKFTFLVGAFPTLENFSTFCGFYSDDFKQLPDPYRWSMSEKFRKDCENQLLEQVAESPFTSINKIFLLKSQYGYVEASHNCDNKLTDSHKTIDEIPQFSITDKSTP